MSGPLPVEVDTLHALDIGLSLSDIDEMPATRLSELLALDSIRKESGDGGSG